MPHLLLATAPWPILLRILKTRPGHWTVWGDVPHAVETWLAAEGHVHLAEPLPRPFDLAAAPAAVTTGAWQAIVVPALGHPLPGAWSVVRQLLRLERTVIVSDGDSWQWVHYDDVPAEDAHTWAADRLTQPSPPAPVRPLADVACVQVDRLEQVLPVWPAIEAAARTRRVTAVVDERVAPWLRAISATPVAFHPVDVEEWAAPPTLPSAGEVVGLASGARATVSHALAHATPAVRRRALARQVDFSTVGEMAADALGVALDARGASPRAPVDVAVLAPSGSCGDRELDAETWGRLAAIVTGTLGVRRWIVAGASRERAAALARTLPGAVTIAFPSTAEETLALLDGAGVLLGVTGVLGHLATLRGVRTIVIDHPLNDARHAQLPLANVEYVRPSSPWWRPQPDAVDVARAVVPQADSYGFAPEELVEGVARAARHLAGTHAARLVG